MYLHMRLQLFLHWFVCVCVVLMRKNPGVLADQASAEDLLANAQQPVMNLLAQLLYV